MLRRAAHFPDAAIGALPHLGDVLGQGALQRPALLGRDQAAFARLLEGVHHLAIDVELELLVGGVADAHRLGVGVARQPIDHPFA